MYLNAARIGCECNVRCAEHHTTVVKRINLLLRFSVRFDLINLSNECQIHPSETAAFIVFAYILHASKVIVIAFAGDIFSISSRFFLGCCCCSGCCCKSAHMHRQAISYPIIFFILVGYLSSWVVENERKKSAHTSDCNWVHSFARAHL